MKKTEKLGRIPDLFGGFIPQGMTAVEGTDVYMICGYTTGDANSRIYRYDADGNIVKILLEYEDGKTYSVTRRFTPRAVYQHIERVEDIRSSFRRCDEREKRDTVRFVGLFEFPAALRSARRTRRRFTSEISTRTVTRPKPTTR
jgi:hypothetical protein